MFECDFILVGQNITISKSITYIILIINDLNNYSSQKFRFQSIYNYLIIKYLKIHHQKFHKTVITNTL